MNTDCMGGGFIIKGKRHHLELSETLLLPCNLFLDSFSVGFCKKVQHGTAEVVGVAIWVPQLICNGIQEEIST